MGFFKELHIIRSNIAKGIAAFDVQKMAEIWFHDRTEDERELFKTNPFILTTTEEFDCWVKELATAEKVHEVDNVSEIEAFQLEEMVSIINNLTQLQKTVLETLVFNHFFNQIKMNQSNEIQAKYFTKFLIQAKSH